MERAKLKLRLKWAGILVLVALCTIVVWQNTNTVSVEILLWEPEMPRAVLLLVTALIGFGLGIAATVFYRRRGRSGPGHGLGV